MSGFVRKSARKRIPKRPVSQLTHEERTLAALIRGVPIASAQIGPDGAFSVRLVDHSLAVSGDGLRYVASPVNPAEDGYQAEKKPRKWNRPSDELPGDDET